MRILLTGKTGQIGWELARRLPTCGELVAPGRQELDLAHPETVRETVRRVRPELIVNAAAYTDVNRAESEPEAAMALNADAVELLAEEARRLDAGLVHYSTDYVFDGETDAGPYREDDPPNPKNMYGKSKLAGEEILRASGLPFLILRTSAVYGVRGKNFLLLIRKLAREGKEMRIVDDQTTAPTWCGSIAEATVKILERWTGAPGGKPDAETSGVYHLSCAGETTWYGFAEAILKTMGSHNPPGIWPIPTTEFPSPAERPKYSVLSNEKLQRVFDVQLPHWEDALKQCLQAETNAM